MSNSTPIAITVPTVAGLGAAVSVSSLGATGRTLLFAGLTNGDVVELWGGPTALLLGPIADKNGQNLTLVGPNDHTYFDDRSLFYALKRIAGSGSGNCQVVGEVSSGGGGGSGFSSGFDFKCYSTGPAANVPNLAAYTVAGNDGQTNVEGDVVLLYAQTVTSQNGPWNVGTVAAGVAPLTRPAWWTTGQTIIHGATVHILAGTLFAGTTWIATVGIAVDSANPVMVPMSVSQQVTLVAGTVTITNVPILNTAHTSIRASRLTPAGTANTVQYNPVSIVAGPFGTASFALQAQIAAGTINVADTSTLMVNVTNQA
jgi:hypothetical protein